MSLENPDKAERAWMDAIVRLGCIVCRNQGRGYVPAVVHHIIRFGRRMGHLYTLPLCEPGHHKDAPPGSGEISRHPWRRAFETRYGKELDLLEQVRQLIRERKAA